MKPIQFFILLNFIIASCNSEKIKSETAGIPEKPEQITGRKFFNYDAVTYYFIDSDKIDLHELYDNRFKSEIDSFKAGVLSERIPEDSSGFTFVDRLTAIGYKKAIINKSDFKEIDDLFAEKPINDNLTTAGCPILYLDILVFKRNNKVIGTAKISFDCEASQFSGTDANTTNFGHNGDYLRLEKILKTYIR